MESQLYPKNLSLNKSAGATSSETVECPKKLDRGGKPRRGGLFIAKVVERIVPSCFSAARGMSRGDPRVRACVELLGAAPPKNKKGGRRAGTAIYKQATPSGVWGRAVCRGAEWRGGPGVFDIRPNWRSIAASPASACGRCPFVGKVEGCTVGNRLPSAWQRLSRPRHEMS